MATESNPKKARKRDPENTSPGQKNGKRCQEKGNVPEGGVVVLPPRDSVDSRHKVWKLTDANRRELENIVDRFHHGLPSEHSLRASCLVSDTADTLICEAMLPKADRFWFTGQYLEGNKTVSIGLHGKDVTGDDVDHFTHCAATCRMALRHAGFPFSDVVPRPGNVCLPWLRMVFDVGHWKVADFTADRGFEELDAKRREDDSAADRETICAPDGTNFLFHQFQLFT